MSKIEHWAHLLYPSMNFDDFIARVETLGEKRMVQVFFVVQLNFFIPLPFFTLHIKGLSLLITTTLVYLQDNNTKVIAGKVASFPELKF